MDYEQIKEALAPCGLSCGKCFAHQDGDIRRYSLKLKESLGNFEGYAKRFETILDKPIFKKYPGFKEMLDYLASENCQGCRNEQCRLFKNCGVRGCQQEKRVDFCFQCEGFPCNRTNFDDRLHKIWVLINEKIKRTGLEQYYEETVNRPRYV
jgi:hypothetical protein